MQPGGDPVQKKGLSSSDPICSRLFRDGLSPRCSPDLFHSQRVASFSPSLMFIDNNLRTVFLKGSLDINEDSGRSGAFEVQMNESPVIVFQQIYLFSSFQRRSFLKCLKSHQW